MKRLLLSKLCLGLIPTCCFSYQSTDPIEGRYSFSLTTFHPSGSLPQLNAACNAACLGPPVIGFSLNDGSGILLASSIQDGPSPLIHEDGTDRFVKITKSIVMGHSGINADGRVLCAAAQRLAVEHEYTFDEEIPINTFLEEMSLLLQRYTMKPGSRPFGCSLLVCFLQPPRGRSTVPDNKSGKIFTLDPSGAVFCWEDGVALIGKDEGDSILQEFQSQNEHYASGSADEILQRFATSVTKVEGSKNQASLGIDITKHKLLCAHFNRNSGLKVWRTII